MGGGGGAGERGPESVLPGRQGENRGRHDELHYRSGRECLIGCGRGSPMGTMTEKYLLQSDARTSLSRSSAWVLLVLVKHKFLMTSC